MRIAIPLYQHDVAPRFCSADRVLLAEVVDGAVVDRQVLGLAVGGLPRRLDLLADLGVTRLLCGGFNRRFLPLAERLGMEVRWGLIGDAEEALDAFLAGRLPAPRPCAAGRGGRRRRRRRGPREH